MGVLGSDVPALDPHGARMDRLMAESFPSLAQTLSIIFSDLCHVFMVCGFAKLVFISVSALPWHFTERFHLVRVDVKDQVVSRGLPALRALQGS